MSAHADLLAPWDPLAPDEVALALDGVAAPWWIAGGHAVAFAVGHPFREHADTDVGLLRRDQHTIRAAWPDWEWWAADPPGTLRPWPAEETLPASVHDLWCRPGPTAPWRLQAMLDDSEGERWVFRRDTRITLPLTRLVRRAPEGPPYLAPEVQLLYKASARRPKDELDLTAALPVLDARQRRWLTAALARVHGVHHPWLPRVNPRSP
ncbi:nucleotidyltransferase domain-containing protein [Nocardiopsis sp. NPDC006938]|uniref:nucleotidyltransferase domain-containing protein n=1 Tax=Nocardiopsis sp. NPDC006938 TaxID=3364337 RepID=UPI0036801361